MSMSDSDTSPADLAASESLDALIDLDRTGVDSLRGFQKTSEQAEPAFRPVVARFCTLHARRLG